MKRHINAHELDIFYNHIGAAVWHIQYLEDALIHYLVIKNLRLNPAIAEEEVCERLAKMRKCVLGKVYKQARDLGIIPRDLEPRFEKFVDERNWLIHRSRHECSTHLYDDVRRIEMFNRISMIQDEAISIRKIIYSELSKFMSSEGFDPEQAVQMAHEELRKLVES
jgi:hypothetical protein